MSTARLRGRKLFRWGHGPGGRRWQEWLSGPGRPYLEIQAGLARTQLEHLPLPAGTTWSWTEAYGTLAVDAAVAHGPWRDATAAVRDAVDALVPAGSMRVAHARAARHADDPPLRVLHAGSGWGGLERRAGGLADLPGTPFPATAAGPHVPWQVLLDTGTLPVSDPPAAPVSGPHWLDRLGRSVAAGSGGGPDGWHALLHLGTLRYAAGDRSGARRAWRASLAARRTAWALRNLAEDTRLAGTGAVGEVADLLVEAHSLAPGVRQLTAEALRALLDAGRAAEALSLVDALEPAQRRLGRIRLYECRAAARAGQPARAARLLAELARTGGVDDLREGEDALDDLWYEVHPGRPLPPALDFRMSVAPENAGQAEQRHPGG